MTLKELRIWHWQKLLQARVQQRKHEEHLAGLVHIGVKRFTAKVKFYRDKANFHLGAVQALNDVLPGTAETDLFLESQK